MDISFIILNYKSEHYLIDCIKSLRENISSAVSHEIIIINNDSNKIQSIPEDSNLHIIENGINDGFAKACNKATSLAKGKILFFLNPDTKIISGDFLDLINAFTDSDTGIVSPELIMRDGKIQPWSTGYNITLWEIICNNLGSTRSRQLWTNDNKNNPDWTSGAALAINNKLFTKIKGFDENFFMYFEDVDLCKKVTNLNLKIKILSSIKILHFSGQSSSSLSQQKKYYYKSQDYYFKKHFGLFSMLLLRVLRNSISLLK